MSTINHSSNDAIAERGDSIYARLLRDRLEPEHMGRIVAIDVHSEAYEVADSALEASRALKQHVPEAKVWLVRIGSRALRHIGRSACNPTLTG